MSIIRHYCCDDETGEVLSYEVNDETGEPSVGNCSPIYYNSRNNHSPIYNNNRNNHSPIHNNSRNFQEQAENAFPHYGYICKTKRFQSLKAKILSGSNTISHRMLLLPTLMICPAIVCSILSILEVYLHIRCHRKNKRLDNPNVYYRSPFHIISSMFCGVCRDIDSASKIGQLQDKRRHRYDYFRGIAI